MSKVTRKGFGETQTGTPYYASPEVWKDETYDLKSDIWSLGCVLYELVTFHPPFRAEDMEGLYKKVIKGSYPKISSYYSKDMAMIIKLMLRLNPEDRPSCGNYLLTQMKSSVSLISEKESRRIGWITNPRRLC